MKRLMLLAILLSLVGCRTKFREEAETGKVNLSVLTTWCGIEENAPQGVVVYFYPEENDYTSSEPIIKHLSNTGGEVYLPIGKYKGFVYNDYISTILFRDMSHYLTAEAYLDPQGITPFSTRNPETKFISQPDLFFLAQIPEFELLCNNSEHSVTVSPELATLTLEMNVPITGIKNVAKARGSISGIAQSLNLSSGKGDIYKTANVVFSFNITSEGVFATIRCFGVLYDETNHNILNFAFLLKNGHEEVGDKYKFDITENITDAIRQGGGKVPCDGIDVVIDDIVVSEEGGFDFNVEGWEDDITVEVPV